METEKKTRRNWIYDSVKNTLSTIELSFNLNKLLEKAKLFLMLYGLKQFLADCLAVPKPIVLTHDEIVEKLSNRFDTLFNDKFRLVHTESGYYWKDPDAVTKRTGGISQSKIYDYFLENGYSHEEAVAAVNAIKA